MINTITQSEIETCICDGCKNIIYKQEVPSKDQCSYYDVEFKKLNPLTVSLICVDHISEGGSKKKHYCRKCFFDKVMSHFTNDRSYKYAADVDEKFTVEFYKERCCESDFIAKGDE